MNKQHSSQAWCREVAGCGTWKGWTMSMGSLSPQSMIQTAKSLPLLPAAYIVLSWPGPPYIPCKSTIGAATCAARSSSVLARSYIPHLRVFYRLICPSGWPLLQRALVQILERGHIARKGAVRERAFLCRALMNFSRVAISSEKLSSCACAGICGSSSVSEIWWR